jgi:transposase-like protein
MSDVMDNQLTILKRDARGRVRSTVKARAEAVAEYRRSGLSASAFATMAGISKNIFWNWLHNHGLTQKRALSKSKSHPPVRFVHVVAQAAPASALLVRLPGRCDCGGGR